MHTYIRTYIHTYIHTYMHTYIYVHTYVRMYVHTYIHASRHMVVCQRPRETQDAQCVIYRKRKVPLYLRNYSTDFFKFTYFMLYIYMTLYIKFERNWVSSEQDIHFQNYPIFFTFFFFFALLLKKFEHIKITFSWFDFFKIQHIYKAH